MLGHAPGALSDHELLAALPRLVKRDNERSAELLAHFAEVDARHLYANLGFSSMFKFCVRSLGLCESSAGRSIAAARVCRRFPTAFALVANGELNLSALSTLSKYLTATNANELFALCARQSTRRIEELLAARFPRPDVPDAISPLPAVPTPCAGSGGAPSTTNSGPAPGVGAPAERVFEPLATNRFAVRFTADSEFRDLLEQVGDLESHRNPEGQLLSLLKAALRSYKAALLKQRFGIGKASRRGQRNATVNDPAGGPPAGQTAPSAPTRAAGSQASVVRRTRLRVSSATARAVYLRDEGCCTFVSQSGQRCAARRFLELDHIVPYVVSLDDRVQNLRLRCREHNQHHARGFFGARYLRAAITRARQRQRVREAA